jgi:hypothetical protein
MDDFESQLSSQKIRPIPTHWKGQILSAASQSVTPAPAQEAWSWRDLLWPCPQVWAGFAAAWLLVLFLNVSITEKSAPATMAAQPPPAPVFVYPKAPRLLAEILGDGRKQPIQPSFVPRRRSEAPPIAVAV